MTLLVPVQLPCFTFSPPYIEITAVIPNIYIIARCESKILTRLVIFNHICDTRRYHSFSPFLPFHFFGFSLFVLSFSDDTLHYFFLVGPTQRFVIIDYKCIKFATF